MADKTLELEKRIEALEAKVEKEKKEVDQLVVLLVKAGESASAQQEMLHALSQMMINMDKMVSFSLGTLGIHHDVFNKILFNLLTKELIPLEECKELVDMLKNNFDELKTLSENMSKE